MNLHRLQVSEDARLWLLDDDSLTLEALRLKHGAKILLEKRSADLTWPEEIAALRGRGGRTERRGTLAAPELPGATGLHNLGNTCYMNAALQAVWNTGPLTRYFNSGTYLYEVNTSNPLGTRGQLALRYGELCKEVWSGGSGSVAPWRVRLVVSRWARHLAGGQQHDAQELLAWLIDCMHEDLRRMHADAPAASEKESWQQYLYRNDSIISELFYGQLWSRVRCSVCSQDSVKLEPFNVLSVPLPIDTDVKRHVLVFRADGSIPTKYGVSLPSEATVWDLKEKIQEMSGVPADTLVLAEAAGALITRTFADTRRVAATPPELHAHHVPPDSDGDDDADSDEWSCDSGVYMAAGAARAAAGAAEVSAASLCMPALFCFQRSRSEVAMSCSPPGLVARSATLPRDTARYQPANSEGSPTPSVRSLNINSSTKGYLGSDRGSEMQDMKVGKIQYLVAVHRKQRRRSAAFLPLGRCAGALFGWASVVRARHGCSGRALYRRVLARLQHLLSTAPAAAAHNHAHDCDDSLGYEFPFTLRAVGSGGAWCAVCPWRCACRGCRLPPTDLPLVRTRPKPRCSVSGELCRVHGQNGKLYDDTSEGRGGELQELDLYTLRQQRREVMLAIDWEPTALHLRYQTAKEKTFVAHASVRELSAAATRGVELASCLRAFAAEETLDTRYHCSTCAEPAPATKLLRLQRAPPVLVIHLKRFQYVNNKWMKSSTPVSFPHEGLDPTEFLATLPQETIRAHRARHHHDDDRDDDELIHSDDDASCTSSDALKTNPKERKRKESSKRERQISQTLLADPICDDNLVDYHQHRLKPDQDPFDLKYRLYAVVSHSGQLSGGHYVSYVRHASGAWLCYNDSSCRQLPAPDIDPAAAYILFYERQGLNYDQYLPDVSGKSPVVEADSTDADENDLRKMCVLS